MDGTLKSSAAAWVPGQGSPAKQPPRQNQQGQAFVSHQSGYATTIQPGTYVPHDQRHHHQQHHHQHGGVELGPGSGEHGEEYDEEYDYTTEYIEADRLVCRACEPAPQRRTYFSSQMPPDLRAYFAHGLKLTMDHLPLTDPRVKEVPKFFTLVNPLDDPTKKRGTAGSTGYPTSMYKVVSRKDGYVYALRRIDNVRGVQGMQQQCDMTVQLWKQVRHANIVPLRQAFVYQRALFLVHDYWPGAQTLLEFVNTRGLGNLLQENLLWSFATQLLTALRVAHDQKISFRGGISLQHVLLTGRNRVRLAGAGLMHLIEARDRSTSEEEHMNMDILGFAKVMQVLCCMSPVALRNPKDSIEFISSSYSKELTMLVSLPFQRPCSVYDALALCSRGLLNEMDELYSHSDALEEYLSKQLETSRLNRLMVKLNLVNERPEYGKSEAASWAETGDRYILKLFRDYVFHQTDESGKPWLDIGHILTSLNKLDVGSSEKILLTSRDGRSILVVTFADVRKCLEDAFRELMEGHRSTQFYQEKRANPNRVVRPAGSHLVHPSAMAHPHGMHNLQQAGGMGMPYGQAGAGQGVPMNPYSNPYQYDEAMYTMQHHGHQPY